MNAHVRRPHDAVISHDLLLACCGARSPYLRSCLGAFQVFQGKGCPSRCVNSASVSKVVLSRSHVLCVSIRGTGILASAGEESGEPFAEEAAQRRSRGCDNGEVSLDSRRAEPEGVCWIGVGPGNREECLVDEDEASNTDTCYTVCHSR